MHPSMNSQLSYWVSLHILTGGRTREARYSSGEIWVRMIVTPFLAAFHGVMVRCVAAGNRHRATRSSYERHYGLEELSGVEVSNAVRLAAQPQSPCVRHGRLGPGASPRTVPRLYARLKLAPAQLNEGHADRCAIGNLLRRAW